MIATSYQETRAEPTFTLDDVLLVQTYNETIVTDL
jgi:hypothetical protein